jgi:hypothetical protein
MTHVSSHWLHTEQYKFRSTYRLKYLVFTIVILPTALVALMEAIVWSDCPVVQQAAVPQHVPMVAKSMFGQGF